MFCTVMGQFEVTCSFFHEGLVYEPDIEQAFERSVDRHLVKPLFARSLSDLILAERLARFHQNLMAHAHPGSRRRRI